MAAVFVPELPKTRTWGATRWLTTDKALIQLSARGKTDDQLWFTFFDEAGHILLHPKKDIFIELDNTEDSREDEANRFASDQLIPPNTWMLLRQMKLRSTTDVQLFAKREAMLHRDCWQGTSSGKESTPDRLRAQDALQSRLRNHRKRSSRKNGTILQTPYLHSTVSITRHGSLWLPTIPAFESSSRGTFAGVLFCWPYRRPISLANGKGQDELIYE